MRDRTEGKKGGVYHYIEGTLERVFPRPLRAKSWRCPR